MKHGFYDKKTIYKTLAAIVALVILMMMTGGSGFAIAIPFTLIAAAKQKEESLFFWILFACMSILGNSRFMPKDMIYSMSNRIVLCSIGIIGGFLFLSQVKSKYLTPLMGMFAYLIYAFIPSSIGWAPMISFLKIIMFMLIFAAMLYAANNAINRKDYNASHLRSTFLAFAIFIIVGSVLLLPVPHLASLDPEEAIKSKTVITSLFTGMLNHSQALGPVTCVIGVFLLSDMLFNLQKPDKLYIFLLLCCPILIFKTSSRTAMGSFLAGVMFAMYFFVRARQIKARWKNVATSAIMTGVVIVCFATLLTPSLRNGIIKYAMKSYTETASEVRFDSDAMLSTRQGLVESQLENFHRRPAIGWGFQVSEEVGYMAERSTGLILTAPIEKGVWISAILEEGGAIGFAIYVVFLIVALALLIQRKAYMGATSFFVFHVSCLGEFSMFSMSSEGGIWYTLLFLSLVFDAKRIQGVSASRQMNYNYTPTNYNYFWR